MKTPPELDRNSEHVIQYWYIMGPRSDARPGSHTPPGTPAMTPGSQRSTHVPRATGSLRFFSCSQLVGEVGTYIVKSVAVLCCVLGVVQRFRRIQRPTRDFMVASPTMMVFLCSGTWQSGVVSIYEMRTN